MCTCFSWGGQNLSVLQHYSAFFTHVLHILHCYFRPTLPPGKQANRNLILKAISEAQDSITKTTAYPTSTSPTARHLVRDILCVPAVSLSCHYRFRTLTFLLPHSTTEANCSCGASHPLGQQRGDVGSHPAGSGSPPQCCSQGANLLLCCAASFKNTR